MGAVPSDTNTGRGCGRTRETYDSLAINWEAIGKQQGTGLVCAPQNVING
jgi:hypothetical protein